MANIYNASCKCGFQRSARTGGTRESFQTESYFPFYCKRCGLINVNVMEQHDLCPRCKSTNITPYGDPTTSLDNKWKMVQCFDYEAPTEGNLCPDCKNKTLSFKLEFIAG
jgi:hypothetical protein